MLSPASQCLSVLVCSLPGTADWDRRLFRRLASTCDELYKADCRAREVGVLQTPE